MKEKRAMKKKLVKRLAFYRNVGYGLTSYEGPDEVVGIRKGRLFTETFERGMEPTGREGEWVFDGGLGMRTYATLKQPDGWQP